MIFFLLIMISLIFPINLDDIIQTEENSSSDYSTSNIYKNDINNFLLDEVVNPDQYKVGPGDDLSFNLISSDGSVSLILKISPIGDVLIPNIGNIFINNMTLSKAIDKIKNKCREKYTNSEIFVSLYSLRQFNVQVFGPGINDGYVTISPVNRLSYIFSEVTENNINEYSIRNIDIYRDDEVYNYDLMDFYIFGNELSNPYIEQNDKIKFNIRKNILKINGAVNIPGVYDYKSLQTLENFIEISGGFTDDADSNYIEITRFNDDKNYTLIKLDDFISNKNFELLSHDNIRIRKKTEFKKTDYIQIEGEISYPGSYLLSEVNTYNDVINLAGGYTDKADTNQITINNQTIQLNKDLELERIMLIPPIDRTPSEKSYITARKKITKGSIRSNDSGFSNFIKNNNPEAGDKITINESIDYIEIIGAVIHPGRYDYDSDKNLKRYIDDAGGYSSNASKQKYLIKASDGKRIKLSKKPRIESGDIIFISSKEDYNTFIRFKEVLQIIGNFAALIAVIQSVSE